LAYGVGHRELRSGMADSGLGEARWEGSLALDAKLIIVLSV